MSTLTSSIFLPRKCLVSFSGGEYLLAANGPFIECFDMDKLRNGDYDEESDLPIKTRVTENSPICHILPLDKSGHVVVITREYRHSCRILTTHLVHKDIVIDGGYVMSPSTSHLLSREENFVEDGEYADTRAEVITGRDEFRLLTSTFVAHYRYSFSSVDNLNTQFIREQEFNLKKIMEQDFKLECRVGPSCISPNIPLQFMMKSVTPNVDGRYSVYLVYSSGSSLAYREYKGHDLSTVELIIPSLDIGILCGEEFTTVVSTKVEQPGMKKNQLKLLGRFPDPHVMPRRIFAIENKEEDDTDIFIVSQQGLLWYRWDGGRRDGSGFFVLHQNEDSNLKIAREQIQIDRDDRDGFRTILSHLNGIIDAIIVHEPTENTIDLVKSRKSGEMETILRLGDDNELCYLSRSFPISSGNSLIAKCASSRDIFIDNNSGSQFSSNIVAIKAKNIHSLDIDRKGTVTRISEERIDIPTSTVTCSDVKFGQLSNLTFILVGCEKGEVYVQILEDQTDQLFEYVIHDEKRKILSVSYFQDPITGNCNHYAVLTNCKLRVIFVEYDLDMSCPCDDHPHFNTKIIYEFNLDKPKEWKDYNMITMGDGKFIHDVWLLFDDIVYLLIGRKQKLKKIITMRLRKWKGAITASSSISTKKNGEDSYLDIITVAKRSKIGILLAHHEETSPAEVIHFTEWMMPPGSDAVGLHTEIVKCENTLTGNKFTFHVDLRLYVIKKKSGTVHISLARLVLNDEGLKIGMNVLNMYKIPSSIRNPYQIAVTNMDGSETKPQVESPKFVIVSGSNGTQVLRICPKKQLHSLHLISFPSNFDKDLVSDAEE